MWYFIIFTIFYNRIGLCRSVQLNCSHYTILREQSISVLYSVGLQIWNFKIRVFTWQLHGKRATIGLREPQRFLDLFLQHPANVIVDLQNQWLWIAHWWRILFMCDTIHIRSYNVKSHWKVQGRNSTPE